MMNYHKLKKGYADKKNISKNNNDHLSNLTELKIKNDNIHIQNIVRTIYYVYTNKYDGETCFSYIKDVLKNIIKGDVYDVKRKKYINGYCIYELCSRIILNIIKGSEKDDNFNKIMEFLFDILYYCDILQSEKKNKQKKRMNNGGLDSSDDFIQEYELITKLWNRLLDNIFLKDKKQRINLCKVIKCLVKKACALQIDVSNKLCKKHVNIFLSLLNDKDHNIRILCLNILEPFQDFNTRASYLKCLDDTNNNVRINAIRNISISVDDVANAGDTTTGGNNYELLVILKVFLVRINDINHNVRIAIYEKLKNYYFYIPSDMKFELLLSGLNDKDKSVRDSCYNMILHWVQLFDDKVENLLLHLISSDIDNDLIVEQICKMHLHNVKKGSIKTMSMDFSDVKQGYRSTYEDFKSINDNLEEKENNKNDKTSENINELEDIEKDNIENTGPFNDEWFNNCINNLFSLNTAELYMFRIYVQHFSTEQEKEKIDALNVINTIYYYLNLSKFNEKLYYSRKNYINCVENDKRDQEENVNMICTCGKNKIDIKQLEENRKQNFIRTSKFDDNYCDKCIYYRAVKMMNQEFDENDINSDSNETKQNDNKSCPYEYVLINEDNINENYQYICNIKNLLLLCKYLDIIEIYQVEKILQCCSTILLKGPLREIIIKCMLNNTGVNYYKLQKGHITCAYWLSNSYIYSCLELLKQMIYIKYKNLNPNEIEINFTNHILTIISEIKEPFENTDNDSAFMDNKINITGNADGEEDVDLSPCERRRRLNEEKKEMNSDELENKRNKKKRNSTDMIQGINGIEQKNKDEEKRNSLSLTFTSIMNVENDVIFDIIRKKNLNTLSIEHLLLLCKKMQHKLDVTEAKIKDLTEMERERNSESIQKSNDANNYISGNNNVLNQSDENVISVFHEQIIMNTQIFLKQITMLGLLRLELKRRWLRILFILECFLCKSKSHCSFDPGLREFPNELLLPALNFCCSIMPEWDDKEIEDQFYDIIVSKCLGNWCMFINNDDELKKQIYAYKTAIVDTCEVLNNCLLNIEKVHEDIYPNIYKKASMDIMNQLDGRIGNGGNYSIDEDTQIGGKRKIDNEEGKVGNSIFYEYNPPNEGLLNYFATNQNAWYDYKELLEKLEINTLRCEIYICVLGDLLMTHPHLGNDKLIIEAIENLWDYLFGSVNTSKYIQSISLRACCKLLLTEYLGNYIYHLNNDALYLLIRNSSGKLRALFEMCFLLSPSTYNCVQDFKKISTYNITNINCHDKMFLLSIFSMYPSMSNTNMLVFHYTLEDIIIKTSEGVLKYKLKTTNFTNILTFMIFTILHKANIEFLCSNFPKYIKWILLIIIEKGIELTSRSNIIQLVYKIIQIYLFHNIKEMKNVTKANGYQNKEVKKRGRKKKQVNNNTDKVNNTENDGSDSENGETDLLADCIDGIEGENNETENNKENSTIFFKNAQKNVNTALKDLKTFYVLINFCMHSSDILKSRNEIRYCEVLKETIDKKIEQTKNYFIKKKLITNNQNNVENGDTMDTVEKEEKNEGHITNENLLNLNEFNSLKEENIYEEIIINYSNYIENITSRTFSYPIVPRTTFHNNERMTIDDILNQINSCSIKNNINKNSFGTVRTTVRANNEMIKKTRSKQDTHPNINNNHNDDKQLETQNFKDTEFEMEMEKEFEINNDDALFESQNMMSNPKSAIHNNEENNMDTSNFVNSNANPENDNEQSGNRKNSPQTNGDKVYNTRRSSMRLSVQKKNNDLSSIDREIKNNKLYDLNLTSSEDTPIKSENSSSIEYNSDKDESDINDNNSCSSSNSNDSTAMTFRRLNKLKRTSYTHVISK
ncbi:merozoite organizing protein, putative [Plasmodium vinckei]|uniref:Merozoite organizing protein, putative n=1 Tax=Plasmodium vinckei TaxID=5860 RepID=A0A6V7STL9_PLAVN|nr:merozoite organizing protein, putative [Plasmodium vinckei]